MDIYLVPVGRHRLELYCEVEERHASPGDDARTGWRAALGRQFHRSLAYLDAERRDRLARAAASAQRSRFQRGRDRLLGWLAERVAEQRLLWYLRSERAATAHYPADMGAEDAGLQVRTELRRDSRRHLFWMIIDGGIYLASLPLTPIPGPNALALYFSFRAIGHLLSWLGARNALSRVAWTYVPSPPLSTLRRLPGLAAAERTALAREVAAQLHLRHLDTFLARRALAGA